MDYDKLSPTLAAAVDGLRAGRARRPRAATPARWAWCRTRHGVQAAPGGGVRAHATKAPTLGRPRRRSGWRSTGRPAPSAPGIVDLGRPRRPDRGPGGQPHRPARRLRPLMDMASRRSASRPSAADRAVGQGRGRRHRRHRHRGRPPCVRRPHPAHLGPDAERPGRRRGRATAPSCSRPTLTQSRDTVGPRHPRGRHRRRRRRALQGVAPAADLVIVKSDLHDRPHRRRHPLHLPGGGRRWGGRRWSTSAWAATATPTTAPTRCPMVIDSAVGPGRIVCCAAGNEGNDNIHAQGKVRKGGARRRRGRGPPAGGRPAPRGGGLQRLVHRAPTG